MSRYVPAFQQHAPSPPELYDLEEVCERSGVLEVRLVGQQERRLHVTFPDHLGFRKAGESDALVTLAAISATSQAGRSFYLVEESDYIRWFVDQSHGIRRPESLMHITIVTIDDVIDVISLSLPSLTVPQ
jgi:hypothetical protein